MWTEVLDAIVRLIDSLAIMDWWIRASELFKNVVTSIAIIVGGAWTYRTFVRQRMGLPRLRTAIKTHPTRIQEGFLLRCDVVVENHGTVVVSSQHADFRCSQIIPLPESISEAVAGGFDPVPHGSTSVDWPVLAGRSLEWPPGGFEVEPGETDVVSVDFFVPTEAKVVEIYFYLKNAKKPKQDIGWTASLIIDLASGGPEMAEKKVTEQKQQSPRPTYTPLQQAPREPQSQQQPKPPQQQQQTKVKTK